MMDFPNLHELLLTSSQVFVIVSSMAGCALVTSPRPLRRVQAFVLFLVGTIPDLHISIVSELWVFVAIAPYFICMNIVGIRNNLIQLREETQEPVCAPDKGGEE